MSELEGLLLKLDQLIRECRRAEGTEAKGLGSLLCEVREVFEDIPESEEP